MLGASKRNLSPRPLVFPAVKLPISLLALALSFSAQSATKPNIVFILADDLGYMDIGANNPKTFYETPNIDRLAARGMRFTAGYSACCVCSPTRASIMTGKYPARLHLTDWLPGRVDRPDQKLNCLWLNH